MMRVFFLLFGMWCFAQEQEYTYTNALIGAKSLYLLEHAHNPVNWQPWGEPALLEAKHESKLIVISIGYASCHWCQVMAEESFEDEDVARVMNDGFVNIKVDREERPDLDQVYMTALQLIKGEGGWPLNVIALPDGRPLYAGTYHTKAQWIQVLEQLNKLYQEQPEKAIAFAQNITNGVKQMNLIDPVEETVAISKTDLETGIEIWKTKWDSQYGGDLGGQKFMLPASLSFLLDYAVVTKDVQAKQHIERTLDAIAAGGVYDHVGQGFFRYATDRQWHIPHFEKMLYDNAQLVSVYAKAYRIFKKPEYKFIAEQTLKFIEEELKSTSGAYNSAIRADTEEGEGAYYIWSAEDLAQELGSLEEAKTYFDLYAFEDQKYVLGLKEGVSHGQLEKQINKLAQQHKLRIKPKTDTKVITSWNALLITAYTEAFKAFKQQHYLDQAKNLFEVFVHEQAKPISHTNDEMQGQAYLEDYAYLNRAALDLYLVSAEPYYLKQAARLFKQALAVYFDASTGVFRYGGDESLIAQIYKLDDDVMPSPNLIMAVNSYELGNLLEDTSFLGLAEGMLQRVKDKISTNASNYTTALSLELKYLYPYYEVVVSGKDAALKTQELWNTYLPNALVVYADRDLELPLFKNRFESQETYIYVCQETFCKLPTTSINEALEQLEAAYSK